jgi:hypothetical protein
VSPGLYFALLPKQMAKRAKSGKKPGNASSAKSDAAQTAAQSDVAAQTTSPAKKPWGIIVVISALVIAAVWAISTRPSPAPAAKKPQLLIANAARNSCKRPPAFVARLGLGANAALSTSERDLLGLAVITQGANGQRQNHWQHPSWRMAGNLSAFAIDARGDIYVIPAPRVNLLENPPPTQNRLYRVDSESAEMRLLLEFPVADPVSQRNPFAGLGLSYDCALDSVFLSSVAGSTPSAQKGRIFRIALRPTAKIASVLDGFDALSVLSVDAISGPALLLGSARNSEVSMQPLAANGDFLPVQRPVAIFDLTGIGPEGNDRARKFEINSDATITVRGMRFAYNLAQPPAQAKPTIYRFQFDLAQGRYVFLP